MRLFPFFFICLFIFASTQTVSQRRTAIASTDATKLGSELTQNTENFEFIHEDSLQSGTFITSRLQRALSENNYCDITKWYYLRALVGDDLTMNTSLRLEDLDLSARYAARFCQDSVAYYHSKLKTAEIMYMSSDKSHELVLEEVTKALDYFTKKGEKSEMIDSYHAIALVNSQNTDYQDAIENIQKAIGLSVETNDSISLLRNRLIGNQIMFLISGEPNVALLNMKEDFDLICPLADSEPSLATDIGLSLAEHRVKSKQYVEALDALYYVENFDISARFQQAKLCSLAMVSLEMIGEHRAALSYSQKYTNLIQNIHDIDEQLEVNKLAERLKTKTLEDKLAVERGENEALIDRAELSRFWIWFLAIAILASLLALYYITRFYTQKIRVSDLIANQREEINKQRFVKLENNMKIQSLSSMVAGQEAERNRIANDLHDSLGGSLSALKLQFENVVLKDGKSEDRRFSNISKLIDSACSEVREIARNLKPASLENIGLEAAVRDLINKYNANSDIKMSFHSYVEGIELGYEVKLNMYRIIQELLNNVMKHANATEVDIQLSHANDEIIINVEDDGDGFNMNWVKKGLGLDSMQSRVNVLKGDLHIDTAPGRGTSVIVHIPMNILEPA